MSSHEVFVPLAVSCIVGNLRWKQILSRLLAVGGAYGRTLRYKNLTKIKKVNDQVVIAASGEMSDLDYIANLLEEFTMMDHCQDDGIQLGPKEVYSILSRVLYNRRTE